MTAVYEHAGIRLFHGNCLTVLRSLPDESVHACVTSPPYLGLRSYLPDGHPDKDKEIGLEGLDAYIARLVEVFRELRRVLRKDSTCWIVMGDSYSAHPGQRKETDLAGPKQRSNAGSIGAPSRCVVNIKPKDLIGVPWRLAFALQADGYYLRSDIIWHKPQVMPESVTDRPTKSHEYVFLLAKAERYFFDNEAIKEDVAQASIARAEKGWHCERVNQGNSMAEGIASTISVAKMGERWVNPAGRNRRSVWTIPTGAFDIEMCTNCHTVYEGQRYARLLRRRDEAGQVKVICGVCGCDDAWLSHFATFPEALVEPMILAGTSAAGCCPRCLTPYRRVVETERVRKPKATGQGKGVMVVVGTSPSSGFRTNTMPVTQTIGWQPGCSCNAGPAIPCTVLDPFVGSGTSVAVAKRLGRHGLGIDLNAEYLRLAERRLHQDVLPLGVL